MDIHQKRLPFPTRKLRQRYVASYFLLVIGCVLLLYLFGALFSGGPEIETFILAIGSVLILLICWLIILVLYLLHYVKHLNS
jgi:amino acid permease